MRHNNIPDYFPELLAQVPQEWRDLLNYLSSITPEDDNIDDLYDQDVHIEFNGHKVSIPFDAVICDQLITTLETMIKEY